ncbi:MAG: hypothetical protein M1823_005561 [Watsoniomyces obsoletus]|nr:MAG: hypothetical protein M1823_005561 [Watsoniomyces obsoletus]
MRGVQLVMLALGFCLASAIPAPSSAPGPKEAAMVPSHPLARRGLPRPPWYRGDPGRHFRIMPWPRYWANLEAKRTGDQWIAGVEGTVAKLERYFGELKNGDFLSTARSSPFPSTGD